MNRIDMMGTAAETVVAKTRDALRFFSETYAVRVVNVEKYGKSCQMSGYVVMGITRNGIGLKYFTTTVLLSLLKEVPEIYGVHVGYLDDLRSLYLFAHINIGESEQ